MRTSILFWSAASGVILGLFIDATLIGVALLVSAMIPGGLARFQQRWLVIAAIVLLAAIPIVAAWLGYLEGELKAV